MKRLLGIMLTALLLLSCSTAYMAYTQDMFDGTQLLRQGEYAQARTYFVKAVEEQKDARSLAFVATANYRLNDLAAAERYLAEAEKLGQYGFSYLRIAGYKALVLLKESKKTEGMEALKDYIDAYKHVYPMPSIDTVEGMWKKDKVDMAALDHLIDEQVTTYEKDIDQYLTTRTGWYSRGQDGGSHR
jgi:tetratricopeptide (TPR) repeat protein